MEPNNTVKFKTAQDGWKFGTQNIVGILVSIIVTAIGSIAILGDSLARSPYVGMAIFLFPASIIASGIFTFLAIKHTSKPFADLATYAPYTLLAAILILKLGKFVLFGIIGVVFYFFLPASM